METVRLAYEEFGSHSAEPVIILHGFFASSRNWRAIAKAFSAIFHVYVLDMRNHGESPHHKTMDYPSMTEDVLRFMDEHGISTAHIIGHSMGGKCAMWLALNYAGRMKKLVIVDIAPKSYQHSFDQTINALISLPLDKVHNRKQAEAYLIDDIPELDYRRFLLQNLLFKNGCYNWRVDLTIFLQAAPKIIAFPASDNLSPYHGLTLFLAGVDSNYVNEDDTAALFPDAEFATIAEAGHWVHTQQPDVFIEVIENFLQ